MIRRSITWRLPEWVDEFLAETPPPGLERVDRMRYVLALARRHILEGTGGPFAAAVFLPDRREPLSVGLNRVEPERCSAAHAEVLALSLAQAEVGDYDLGAEGRPPAQLVTSSQMCAMCLGAVCWSGVREVVFSARCADVEGIVGFDEGPRSSDPLQDLELRGIAVLGDVARAEGQQVLRLYVERGGLVYNGRRSGSEGAPPAS